MRPRRRAGAVGLLALLLPLSACAAVDSAGSPGNAGAGGASRSASTDTVAWNPCGDLSARRVGAALGARVRVDTGTADQQRCAFLPVAQDGPTLNVTYLWFDGRFEQAFASMGRLQGRVSRPAVPGADDARLVVNETRHATLVTGFVKTGRLVETVNAVQLTASDPQAVVRATRRVMTTLVAHAPASEAAAAKAAAAGFPG